MHVDIVIPTWRRAEKLKRCMASIETQAYTDITTHAIEDTDRLFAFGVWNRFLATWETGDLFVYLCDDTILDPYCIAAAVREMQAKFQDTDGLVGLHQSNIAGKDGWCRSAMGVIGRKFAERFVNRQVFCPDYSRFHADSELGAYARELGKFSYCEAASLVHLHPVHNRAEMDETHVVVRDPPVVLLDKRVWERRRAIACMWGKDNMLVREDVRDYV